MFIVLLAKVAISIYCPMLKTGRSEEKGMEPMCLTAKFVV